MGLMIYPYPQLNAGYVEYAIQLLPAKDYSKHSMIIVLNKTFNTSIYFTCDLRILQVKR